MAAERARSFRHAGGALRHASAAPPLAARRNQIKAYAAAQSGAGFDSAIFSVAQVSCGNQVSASYPLTLPVHEFVAQFERAGLLSDQSDLRAGDAEISYREQSGEARRVSRDPPTALRQSAADRAGGVTTVFALSLPAIVGFAGLGAEAASWYLTKRTMQGAADTAASAAATALSAGTTSAAALASEARSIAARSNFVNGSNGTTVTVNYPPSSGTYQGRANAVEVSISKQEPALLSALFLAHGPTIGARAVAQANLSVTAEACVIALDKNNETAMTTSGSPNLSFPGCSLYANSPASAALNMNGSASISANKAYFVGNYSGGGLTTANGIYRGVDPIIDPYRNIAVPGICRLQRRTITV